MWGDLIVLLSIRVVDGSCRFDQLFCLSVFVSFVSVERDGKEKFVLPIFFLERRTFASGPFLLPKNKTQEQGVRVMIFFLIHSDLDPHISIKMLEVRFCP